MTLLLHSGWVMPTQSESTEMIVTLLRQEAVGGKKVFLAVDATRHQRVHPLYFTMSTRCCPERRRVRVPLWKSLGLFRCVTNKEKSGFGKANDRVKAKDHRPQGIPVIVWWGALSVQGKKLGQWKAIIGFPVSLPRAQIKR